MVHIPVTPASFGKAYSSLNGDLRGKKPSSHRVNSLCVIEGLHHIASFSSLSFGEVPWLDGAASGTGEALGGSGISSLEGLSLSPAEGDSSKVFCLARANSRERFLPIPTLPLLFWDWSWVHWPSGKRGSVGDMYALSPLWPYMDWVGVLGLVFKPSLASPIDWTHTPAAYAPVAGTAIAGAPGQGHQMTPVWRVGWVLKLFEVQEYS